MGEFFESDEQANLDLIPTKYHPLDNIEDVDEFYAAIDRSHLSKSLSSERPYTYWTIELYDKQNGIRGGGGLGILAADTRRVAERQSVPFVLITPFYPSEQHQVYENLTNTTTHKLVDYRKYGFSFIDTVSIKSNNQLCYLDVIEKTLGSTKIIAITEPNFGELYSGDSNGDHRLYQEVALGFGGYQALKLAGLKPAIMQLNEVATFFAALARLDELSSNGMDFYEAVVYTRKHTLYTNHTLVQAAEADFSLDQFNNYVFPNLKSLAVKKWLRDKFENGRIRLSSVTIEIAELKSGVSKLHARVANYRDLAGNKVKFRPITNGIDIPTWTNPDILNYLKTEDIIDKFDLPSSNFLDNLEHLTATKIKELKSITRARLNQVLSKRKNHRGEFLYIDQDALIVDFKRRFVEYKRPELIFANPDYLASLLEQHNIHYFLAGRVHEGDYNMSEKLKSILQLVDNHPILKNRVHYLPDYDEELGRVLSEASNISINNPIVGLEACGTSWMKDIINLGLLISTHDGGVADVSADNYLSISGQNQEEEIISLYNRLDEASRAWNNDFDLEFIIKKQLAAYLPIISGTRMLKDYLDLLF